MGPASAPIPGDRADREGRGIGRGADDYMAAVGQHVVDAVRDRAADRVGQEVMGVDLLGLPTPAGPGVLERTDQLLLLSVDTKKKELIGPFKNAGACWCRQAEEVNAHDFLTDAVCRAVPYGIYDVLANCGHVVVGTSADTPAFAVSAIARYWGRRGAHRYPDAPGVLLLADAGGSNGCRPRLWKRALQVELADRYGLVVAVCHYPTGASKWNPVEHRLFGPISTNWAGVPLRSPEVMLGCLRRT